MIVRALSISAAMLLAAADFQKPVWAGSNENAKIVVHLATPTAKNACSRPTARPSCSGIVSNGALAPTTYFAYLLVVDGDPAAGIAGVQCGIQYLGAAGVGVDVFSWTNCATLEFPMAGWPAPGTGTIITWDPTTHCQQIEPGGAGTGVVATAGYFYCAAYTPDVLTVIPRPADLAAKVASCGALEDTIDSPTVHHVPPHLGFASFSLGASVPGYAPCEGTSSSDSGGGGGDLDSGDSPDGIWTQSNSYHSANWPVLLSALSGAPLEFTAAAEKVSTTLSIPMPSGAYERFRIERSPILSEDLAAFLPQVTTFSAQGVDNPTSVGRLDVTPEGFHATLLTLQGTIRVQPVVRGSSLYQSRSADSSTSGIGGFCRTESDTTNADPAFTAVASGAVLSTYRLAINATGEYTQYFGGVTAATNQIVSTVNAINAVYERELAIRFTLVAVNPYPDPAIDPFDPNSPSGDYADQNQTPTDATVGNANYDLGHLFHAGLPDGRAVEPALCNNARKAEAFSSYGDPTSNVFIFGYVPHEMGHQLNGRHTMNPRGSSICCHGRGPEPFNGTTIMSYAGFCSSGPVPECGGTCGPPYPTACNAQATNDAYYHTDSYERIVSHRDNPLGGASCGSKSATGNTPPTVSAGPDVTIPRNTPFRLVAVGADADGDAITYCWEQNDDTVPPTTEPPLFRSRLPTTDPSRTFPPLADVLAGISPVFEELPSTDRQLTFRVTVRDNQAGAGGVVYDERIITVQGDPFLVTYPNGGESFYEGSTLDVTWTVGGGSVAGLVDIVLVDHGTTSTILAAGVPNDGVAQVTLPMGSITSQARIMIRAMGNVFFDVSDEDFAIASASGVGDAPSGRACRLSAQPNPTSGPVAIEFAGSGDPLTNNSLGSITVLNVTGQIVRRLYTGIVGASPRVINWDGTTDAGADAGSGVFFVKLNAGEMSATVKVLRIR